METTWLSSKDQINEVDDDISLFLFWCSFSIKKLILESFIYVNILIVMLDLILYLVQNCAHVFPIEVYNAHAYWLS
jgi:hypothetical protein